MHDEHEQEHEHEHGAEEAMELEYETQSQIFLQMRQQNVDLLKIAAEVAGFSGSHAPLKGDDLRQAMARIWEIYSEFYEWVDPEESDEGEEE